MDDSIMRVTAFFESPDRFQHATGEFIKSGHAPECYMPWPIHGMDATLGLKRSWVGRPVLAIVLIGFALGIHLCWFSQSQDYPLNVGGKPFFAWQTFMVVILETGLLLGSLANMGLALHTSRLMPDPQTRLINDRITDDLFCLIIPVRAQDNAEAIRTQLLSLGANEASVRGSVIAGERKPDHA